jgi:DNA-binding response OmpR family regulator
MAYADSLYAARMSRQFRRQGWEVHLVHSGVEARRLAHRLRPHLLLLDADLPDESGWLTCAKLRNDAVNFRVYIVGDEQRLDAEAFGRFVGAAGFIRRDQGQVLFLDDCRDIPLAV